MRAEPRAYLRRDTNDFGPNSFVREAGMNEELTTEELMDLRVILFRFMPDKEAHKKIGDCCFNHIIGLPKAGIEIGWLKSHIHRKV
jgi:hypothetical protein